MASTSKTREHSSKSTLESIKIHHPETYNKYQRNSHDYEYDDGGGHHMDDDGSSDDCVTSPKTSNNLLDVIIAKFYCYLIFFYLVDFYFV